MFYLILNFEPVFFKLSHIKMKWLLFPYLFKGQFTGF